MIFQGSSNKLLVPSIRLACVDPMVNFNQKKNVQFKCIHWRLSGKNKRKTLTRLWMDSIDIWNRIYSSSNDNREPMLQPFQSCWLENQLKQIWYNTSKAIHFYHLHIWNVGTKSNQNLKSKWNEPWQNGLQLIKIIQVQTFKHFSFISTYFLRKLCPMFQETHWFSGVKWMQPHTYKSGQKKRRFESLHMNNFLNRLTHYLQRKRYSL